MDTFQRQIVVLVGGGGFIYLLTRHFRLIADGEKSRRMTTNPTIIKNKNAAVG